MSWIVVNDKTGKGVLEFNMKSNADLVNAKSKTHKAIPVLEYLGKLNREIKENDRKNAILPSSIN